MGDVSTIEAVERARALRAEIRAFEAQWPDPPSGQSQMPRFTWEQLERQLSALSTSPTSSAQVIAGLIADLKNRASLVPPEMLLRDLLLVTSGLLEETPGTDRLGG